MNTLIASVDQERAEGCLGASEAPGALGLDKYNPPISVWRRLRGLPVEDNRSDEVREAAKWGNVLEPVVRGDYALEERRQVWVPVRSLVRDGWLRCTPDGFVMDAETPGTVIDSDGADPVRLLDPAHPVRALGHLQVKTCSQRAGWQWEHGVPPRHEVQVRTEMAVTGLPWCDVVCLIGGQHKVGPFRVHRDEAIEANILRDLGAFWERVKSGIEPDVDATAAWRAFASERMANVTPKTPLKADAELDDLLKQWRTARSEAKAHKEHEETLKTSLLLRLGAAGATIIESALGNVTAYKTGARADWKGYAISLGGSATPPERFRGVSKSWALKAPPQWGKGDDDE